jgi:uncharacterized protein
MLSSTYVHCQGIGEKTEREIWAAGGRDWSAFLENEHRMPLTVRQRSALVPVVETSVERLEAGDAAYFGRTMKPREHWRAYPDFGRSMAFVDIETTGMGTASSITVIGLYDGSRVRTYVRGFDLADFEEEISRYDMVVTFFGTGFDLPCIRHAFPGISLPSLHIDLCMVLRRLKLTGGLKRIEKQLGVSRSAETDGLDGWDAVRLWREWESGSREALDLLVAYNREDIVNLAPLLDYAYTEMRKLCFPDG